MSFSASDVHSFLTRPLIQSFLRTHPNSYAESSNSHLSQDDFGDLLDHSWTDLVSENFQHELTDEIRRLQLDRTPLRLDNEARGLVKLPSEQGMSPKKLHEVSQMVAYILEWIRTYFPSEELSSFSSTDPGTHPTPRLRIVDVGAGQGYLTRALKFHLPHTHILALDADEEQTKGSQRWETRLLPPTAERPAIRHKTTLVSSETLGSALTDWVQEVERDSDLSMAPSPILFVALHACGSLTVDVLRTLLSRATGGLPKSWYPAGAVVVGCCYNLMNVGDFPLSMAYRSLEPPLDLPTAAYHLAAQVPAHWLSSQHPPTPSPSTALAVRKVAWRALLGIYLRDASPTTQPNIDPSPRPLPTPSKSATVPARWNRRPDTWDPSAPGPSPTTGAQASETSKDDPATMGTGETPAMRRLGKLHKSVYEDWNTLLRTAESKMGIKLPQYAFDDENPQKSTCAESTSDEERVEDGDGVGERGKDARLERRLEGLHTWRCLLGPVVESAILHDRVAWIRETLGGPDQAQSVGGKGTSFSVEMANLFDQASGSGRNVAIVVSPDRVAW